GLRYAVLGCGNKQWRSTYQKFPRQIHKRLGELGGEALVDLGSCDADGDFDAAAEAWQKGLWPRLAEKLATRKSAAVAAGPEEDGAPLYSVELVNFAGTQARAVLPNSYPLHEAAILGVVVKNLELQSATSERSTRHLEIELPDGVGYAAGDHL